MRFREDKPADPERARAAVALDRHRARNVPGAGPVPGTRRNPPPSPPRTDPP